MITTTSQSDGVVAHRFGPDGTRVADGVPTGARNPVESLVALPNGTFLMSTSSDDTVSHLAPLGTRLGAPAPVSGGAWLSAGKPGDPVLAVGRGAQSSPLRNQNVGSLVSTWPGATLTGTGLVSRRGRTCVGVNGLPGDLALVNLTPVAASGPGNGQLVSSDVASPPVASNVNFGPGTVDPNVAAAPIGSDGRVCYVNSEHNSVHLIADHLATISSTAITLATPTGAPARRIDTRPAG
jgi:hypothetical protein